MLPVGGMKEKLLAAHTAGMARVIVPARNMRDVQVSGSGLLTSVDGAAPVPLCSHALGFTRAPHGHQSALKLAQRGLGPPYPVTFSCPVAAVHLQADVPAEVRDALEIVPAERLEDALRHAFDPPLDLQQLAPRARL